MRVILLVLVTLGIAAMPLPVAARQQPATPAAKPPATGILTLSGCITPDPTKPGAFNLSDTAQGASYRLTGPSVKEYAGQRVQISGSKGRRVRIVGGLYPSANAAGQAGGVDPTRAAVEAASQPGTSGQALPEFRVRSVRTVPGACPQG